jgi:hypothetical protein
MAYVEPIKVKKADVARIIAATFPDYRGQKIRVRPATSESLQDLNWSGGSRSQYRACTLDGRSLGTSAEYHTHRPHHHLSSGRYAETSPSSALTGRNALSRASAGWARTDEGHSQGAHARRIIP